MLKRLQSLSLLGMVLCLIAALLPVSAEPLRPRVKALPVSQDLWLPGLRTIVTLAEEDERLNAAVADLKELMSQRYGVQLMEVSGGTPARSIVLEIEADRLDPEQPGSFEIRQGRSRLYIRAGDLEGLNNGIYRFCHEVLGARWYWAEAIGFEWDGEAPKRLSVRDWHESPGFIMRYMYRMSGDYVRRNLLVNRYHFNHALGKIFDRELFERSPEIFSEIQGRRIRPHENNGTDAQPNFASEASVLIASIAAKRAFEKDPNRESFSLSVNDNTRFDESAATEAIVSPVEYFRERPNYTDLVFGFMNRVAERVFPNEADWKTPKGRPRYLTALAYYWTEQSPSFQIHPMVMPILTSDRAQWHDPDYRAEDKALIERWSRSGARTLATWDYYFGAPYPYPRQFNQWIGESLPYLHAHGVRAFFSQLPAAWGMDGGKAWLATQLLWNPSADPAELLDEYYENFFGPAAEPIRAFYEFAERYRNANEGEANWIKYYLNEAGIELFDAAALQAMRAFIDQAEALSDVESRYGQRVQIVSRAFRFTELYAAYEHARSVMVDDILNGDEDAVDWGLLVDFIEARQAFELYSEDLVKDPMQKNLASFVRLTQSDPLPIYLAAKRKHLHALPDGVDLSGYATELSIAEDLSESSKFFMSLHHNPELKWNRPERAPRSFLGPNVPEIAKWAIELRESEYMQVASFGPDSAKGLRLSGFDYASLSAVVPVSWWNRYLLNVEFEYRVSEDNITQIRIEWLNAENERILREKALQLPIGESVGVEKLALPLQVPEEARNVIIKLYTWRQEPDDYISVRYLDLKQVNLPR